MKNHLIFFVFILFVLNCKAQEFATVTSSTLNLRSGPAKEYTLIRTLIKNDTVSVVEKYQSGWCRINFKDTTGFVLMQFLNIDPYHDWTKKVYKSGTAPECENITPEFANDIDNYLKVNIGKNTDVTIKLMKFVDSVNVICIRKVYINSGTTFNIRNIPQGYYYLKIAYGKDWREKIIDGQCYGVFAKNSLYKKGKDILDFYFKDGNDHISIPSYELWLDVISNAKNNFNSRSISEEEFNK